MQLTFYWLYKVTRVVFLILMKESVNIYIHTYIGQQNAIKYSVFVVVVIDFLVVVVKFQHVHV
jgi:hypothetical protein